MHSYIRKNTYGKLTNILRLVFISILSIQEIPNYSNDKINRIPILLEKPLNTKHLFIERKIRGTDMISTINKYRYKIDLVLNRRQAIKERLFLRQNLRLAQNFARFLANYIPVRRMKDR